MPTFDLVELYQLQTAVKNLAMELAPDYPNIETVGALEQLWAIRTTCEGTKKANEDWQAFGQQVRIRYKLSDKTLQSLFPQQLK